MTPQPTNIIALVRTSVATLLLLAATPSQWRPVRTVPKPIDFATSQNDNLFSLIRSQDDIHALETALEDLKQARHDAAVRRLHELLRVDPVGVVPVAPGRYLGVRSAVVSVLANMSATAKALYEDFAAREAGLLMTQPLDELSPTRLEQLADRFPTTNRGFDARLLIGDRALERGDGLSASANYRAALDASAIDSPDERRAIDRIEVARVLIDPRTTRADAKAGFLSEAALDVMPAVEEPAPGQIAINGARSGRTPMDEPIGEPRKFWSEEIRAPGFERRAKGELAMFPVGDLNTVFVATGREVVALDPLDRSVRWVSLSPLRDFGADHWDREDELDGARSRRRFRSSPGDTINQDMVLAAAVNEDVVVSALQVPDTGANVDFQGGYRIISKIPQRRLFAFSRQTGKVVWQHWDEIDGPRTRRFRGQDSCGPPIIAGDTVYAPIYDRSGAIAFSIGAYDLNSGRLKWRRLVCSSQQDVNMFGNARMEYAASPITLHRGVIYGATNLGVAFAVDALSGRIRWITSYDVVRMPRAMLHGQAERQVYFSNNAPVVIDGVVGLTPLDSQFVMGIDAESGAINWSLPYDARIGDVENRVQWLCGAIGGEFILAGAGVVGVKARPDAGFDGRAAARQIIRPDQIRDPRRSRMQARPAVTAAHIYVPTAERVLAFDRTGAPHLTRPSVSLNGYQPGNLMLVDGALCSLRNRAFELMLDASALLERSTARVRAAPDDPAELLQLAILQRSLLGPEASLTQAAGVQELFERGLQACLERGLPPHHPTRAALQRELFLQALQVAQAAAKAEASSVVELLARARDLAPTEARWIEVQTQLLVLCHEDRERFLRELDALLERSPAGVMPPPLMMRVPAFVMWQRAERGDKSPAVTAQLWQQLLDAYGNEPIAAETAGAVAERALTELIKTHGREVYAAIEGRAAAALKDADGDLAALRDLTRAYPNSLAAERASMTLLDQAVNNGDLGAACTVLARARRNDQVTPGVLRRVQVAALARENRPLAQAMAERLERDGETRSDWRDDEGMSFAAASRAAMSATSAATAKGVPTLPSSELAKIAPRTRQEYIRMLPTRVADGFSRPADAPIYVVAGSDLTAFDISSGAGQELFSESVEFLEHCILCGTTLIVPDMERLFAVDYRTGSLRWELAFEQPRLIESLGVTNGILHISAQPAIPDGNSELIGVEPLTGTTMFQRSLDSQHLKPKPGDGELLLMSITSEVTAIDRLDPITGAAIARIDCAAVTQPGLLTLRADSLATRLYPQGICADEQRIYLPIDSRNQANPRPQVIALGNDGAVAWRWLGTSGMSLMMAQRCGDRFVVAENSDQQSCRLVLLNAADGSEVRAVDIGYEAAILNWESSWLHNPAPATIAVGSEADLQQHQRQLICIAVDDGPSFAVPLRPTDGNIEREPLFGDGFVTFGCRPRSAGSPFRLYAIDLTTRRGAFEGNSQARPIRSNGIPHGMAGIGSYTVLATTQGLIVLGTAKGQTR